MTPGPCESADKQSENEGSVVLVKRENSKALQQVQLEWIPLSQLCEQPNPIDPVPNSDLSEHSLSFEPSRK